MEKTADFLFCGKGPRSRCYGRTAALRLIVQPCDEDDSFFFRFSVSSTGGMKLTGENRSTRRKTCPSAMLSTTNPTWTEPGSIPGLRGERPATNRLSHGTARRQSYLKHCHKITSGHASRPGRLVWSRLKGTASRCTNLINKERF
jgi:hypothetical protein